LERGAFLKRCQKNVATTYTPYFLDAI
jgi:hypothetical protein